MVDVKMRKKLKMKKPEARIQEARAGNFQPRIPINGIGTNVHE